MQYTHSLAVIGAGSYGTALAMTVANKNLNVLLYARNKEQALNMQASRYNEKYLPNIKLPDTLSITSDFKEAVLSSQNILLVIPSHTFRTVLN